MPLTQVASWRHTRSMKTFSPDHKIHADSLIEIREGFDDAVKTLARGAIRWGTVRIKKVQVLNALVLWFLRQPLDAQKQIIGETMPILRDHFDHGPKPIVPLIAPDVGCKRAAYAVNQAVVDSDALGDNRVSGDHGAPKRRR